MAKRVIILDRPDRLDPNTYRVALWAAVPAARQSFFAVPNAVSAWRDASAAENSAIASGAIKERVELFQFPPGATGAQMQNHIEARWQLFQNEITNVNLWQRYGSFWDSASGWTMTGVA